MIALVAIGFILLMVGLFVLAWFVDRFFAIKKTLRRRDENADNGRTGR